MNCETKGGEAKFCPFCGGRPRLLKNEVSGLYSINCTKCFAGTDKYFKPETALEAWNSRSCVSDGDIKLVLDTLQAVCRTLAEKIGGRPADDQHKN